MFRKRNQQTAAPWDSKLTMQPGWNLPPEEQAALRPVLEPLTTGTARPDHGRATLLAGNDDLTAAGSAEGAQFIPLGRWLAWHPLHQQGHALSFGSTRSGKGVSAIIPALLSYAGSMVCIDPKAENCWVSAPRRRQLGQRVVTLDPWNEVNRRYAGKEQVEQITRFNPLAVLDPKSPDFGDEVAAVADALITTTSSDTHWSDSARELIGGLVAAYIEARPGKATLRDVRRALLISQDDFAKLIEFFEAETPKGLGVRKLAGYKIGSREVDSIRSTAKTQTAFLDSERLCDSLDGEEEPFDLAELATGRVTLYLVLPIDRLGTHGRWLRLILTLAIRAISRQPQQPRLPVLFMLDEMGTIGRLAMIEQAFGLMAGVGVRIWGFLQDLNQLKRDYPEGWETFIANSFIIQALNVNDLTTAKYISDLLGMNTVERLSDYTIKRRSGTAEPILQWPDRDHYNRYSEYAKNFSLTERPLYNRPLVLVNYQADPNFNSYGDEAWPRQLMLPQEVREIPADKVLNIFPRGKNYMVDRLYYYRQPQWIPMLRPNPHFPPPQLVPVPPEPETATVPEAEPAETIAPPSEPLKRRRWWGR